MYKTSALLLIVFLGLVVFAPPKITQDVHSPLDYSRYLSILEQSEAGEIEGDFIRLIVHPWRDYPFSIAATNSLGDDYITLVETAPLLSSDSDQPRPHKVIRRYVELSGVSSIKRNLTDMSFFDLPETIEGDCFHPTRYWVEARIGEDYNLIRRDCDRDFAMGYAAILPILNTAQRYFYDDDLSDLCSYCPGFPRQKNDRSLNQEA